MGNGRNAVTDWSIYALTRIRSVGVEDWGIGRALPARHDGSLDESKCALLEIWDALPVKAMTSRKKVPIAMCNMAQEPSVFYFISLLADSTRD